MIPLYLSRARLRATGSVEALSPLLVSGGHLTPLSAKALVWTLFADERDRRRDFLWRLDRAGSGRLTGEFLILSTRPPKDSHQLFDLETKKFAPNLSTGDRLAFRLRANPVVRRRIAATGRSKKHDVVMDALRAASADVPRSARRRAAVYDAGASWVSQQIAKVGGEIYPEHLFIDGYAQIDLPNENGKPLRFSTIDFDGVLKVTDPERLLHAVSSGFGASKAYGCGLMLIRRT